MKRLKVSGEKRFIFLRDSDCLMRRANQMNTSQLVRFAGWSAYVTAVAIPISFVTLFVFFAVGGLWGPINDISSVFFALSLIPPALAWHHLHRSLFPRLSLVNLAIGIIAMLTLAILQAALVVGIVEYEQSLRPVLAATLVIGLWLVVNGVLASRGSHREGTVPRGLAWVSLVAGIGSILVGLGFWIGGEEHPLTAVGGLVSFAGIFIWAIWFGKLLLSGKPLVSERVTPPR
jgi:hypothetical protein